MQAMTNLLVVQVSFPGVSVADQERANVRPPNPSLCVGNGFVIEITDLVCSGRRSPMHQIQLLPLPDLSPTLLHFLRQMRVRLFLYWTVR